MNISEFAKIAGVSKSAVSRYFNDGYLSDEKRRQIEDAIQKTGYSPSIAAQNVRTRITKLVGVILPKLSSESIARITEGISQVLTEDGYELLLANTANNHHKEIEYLDLFRKNRVDGVIFIASIFTKQHQAILQKMHIPVIIVGQAYPGFHCVCHDDQGAAYALTRHMITQGGKIPGYIGVTPDDKAAGDARHQGFLQAIQEAGLQLDRRFFALSEFTTESGYRQAKRILSQGAMPDFLFCATDTIAAGVVQYCNEQHIRIPEELMIGSVGDSKIGQVTAVPLTTAHLHYKTSGMESARMLLSAIRNQDSVPRILQLDYEIIPRQSTQRKQPQYETV